MTTTYVKKVPKIYFSYSGKTFKEDKHAYFILRKDQDYIKEILIYENGKCVKSEFQFSSNEIKNYFYEVLDRENKMPYECMFEDLDDNWTFDLYYQDKTQINIF